MQKAGSGVSVCGKHGDSAVEALVFVLKERYSIKLGGRSPCSSIEEIEAALVDISGTAAEILIMRMRAHLGK
ncbi:MAG: hypothetical protein ABI347_06075 [Nitrososphaera sp.]